MRFMMLMYPTDLAEKRQMPDVKQVEHPSIKVLYSDPTKPWTAHREAFTAFVIYGPCSGTGRSDDSAFSGGSRDSSAR